ncbi:MAG: LOG family protein [Anaerolineales bacterium]|nr:LOG family protein [Anaerolineales bacterium]
MNKQITVFGASNPRPGEPAYEQAQRLGTFLGQRGFTVLTGGYMGTMEAVSRGVVEAGGHTIGVTCEEIENWRKAKANPWVQEEWKKVTLKDRLHTLVESCDAALALPGGIGTLAEIAIFWSDLQVGILSSRPLILIGPEWRATFETMLTVHAASIRPEYARLVAFAEDVDAAVRVLVRALTSND